MNDMSDLRWNIGELIAKLGYWLLDRANQIQRCGKYDPYYREDD